MTIYYYGERIDMNQVLTNSSEQTQKKGQKLGERMRKFLEKNGSGALVVALYGDLGSGKTTFIKGLARGLGIKKIITSPTFTLLKEYKNKGINLYHFDFYRIKHKDEVSDLGLQEYLQKPKSVSVIEWADRIESILPREKIAIKFDYVNKNARKFIFKIKDKKHKKMIANT